MTERKGIVNIINQGIFFSLMFISTTFPLPYKISNLGIAMLVFLWLVKKGVTREMPKYRQRSKNEKLIFFSFLSMFLWYVISLIYTEDISNGMQNVEGKLSFILIPLVMYDLKLEWNKLLLLVKSYIYSMGVCTIYLLTLSIKNYLDAGSLLTYHDFTNALDFHAVFYAYYSFLCILLSIALFAKSKLSKIEKWMIGFTVHLSFVGLVISASKNVLVVTSLSLFIAALFRIFNRRIKVREVILFIAVLAIGIVGVSQLPSVKNRLAELTQLNGMENLDKLRKGEKLEEVDIRKFNGTSLRIVFWYVGINQLMDDNRLLIGLSPGDRRQVMNDTYYENGINPWYENYNIHNQFVQTLVELGLIGLFLYLLIHFGSIRFAIQERNYVLLIFTLGLIIFQMTESIIERNKGIVFLTYFILLLQQFNLFKHENRDTGN